MVPAVTSIAASSDTVPCRTYSNSRRSGRPGRIGRLGCLRDLACLSGVLKIKSGVCAGRPLADASVRSPGGPGKRSRVAGDRCVVLRPTAQLARVGWPRSGCAVLGSALLFGGVAGQPAAKFEVLPVGGLQRLLQGGDLLAVTVLELGQLGGQGPHDAAGLVGIGPSFPGRCRGRWGGLLLGS